MSQQHLWEIYKPSAESSDNCLICMNCRITATTDEKNNVVIDDEFSEFELCGESSIVNRN